MTGVQTCALPISSLAANGFSFQTVGLDEDLGSTFIHTKPVRGFIDHFYGAIRIASLYDLAPAQLLWNRIICGRDGVQHYLCGPLWRSPSRVGIGISVSAQIHIVSDLLPLSTFE